MAWVGAGRLDGVNLNFAAKALIRSNSQGGLCAPAGFMGSTQTKLQALSPKS